MLKRFKIPLLLGAVLCCLTFSLALFAQVVDPCWYGCPKEGCAQCGSTGGPIFKTESGQPAPSMMTARAACKKACQRSEGSRRYDCRTHFPASAEPGKLQLCMQKSKALFQKCKAGCESHQNVER